MVNRTALVIDDEPQIRRVVRHALADDFSRVIEAATGREGIDLAAAEHPHLVVLDLGLPDTTGVEVCVELRKWSNPRPVRQGSHLFGLSAHRAGGERLAFGGGEPGNELQTPMAIVILGGLLSATALNMVVLPVTR